MAKITLENGMVIEGTPEELGEIATLCEFGDDPYNIRVNTKCDHDYFRPQDLELVSDEEAASTTYNPSEGDIVVITANTNVSCNAVGDIGKVSELNKYSELARVHVLNRGDSANWTEFNEMRPATDEEKARYEVAAKFAKIGRKPNEFKKGDIVRVLDREYTGHEGGTIGEVVHGDGSDRPLVKARYMSLFSYSELIAPVESRVDLK